MLCEGFYENTLGAPACSLEQKKLNLPKSISPAFNADGERLARAV
jgi:hypothetical protein